MGLMFLARRALSLLYLVTHPQVPLRLKALPVIAVAYFIWPRDLWPDYLPFGFVDDIIIAIILITIFTARAWPYAMRPGGQSAGKPRDELRKDSLRVDFKVIDDTGPDQDGDASADRPTGRL